MQGSRQTCYPGGTGSLVGSTSTPFGGTSFDLSGITQKTVGHLKNVSVCACHLTCFNISGA